MNKIVKHMRCGGGKINSLASDCDTYVVVTSAVKVVFSGSVVLTVVALLPG